MKERLSDVLAWFGFGFVVFTYSVWGLYEFDTDIGDYMGSRITMIFLGFSSSDYLSCCVTAHHRM